MRKTQPVEWRSQEIGSKRNDLSQSYEMSHAKKIYRVPSCDLRSHHDILNHMKRLNFIFNEIYT